MNMAMSCPLSHFFLLLKIGIFSMMPAVVKILITRKCMNRLQYGDASVTSIPQGEKDVEIYIYIYIYSVCVC
jgi:hypothetical protein